MRWMLLAMLVVVPCLSAQEFDLPVRAPRAALFEIERGGGGTTHEMGFVSAGGAAGLAFRPLGLLFTGSVDFWLASYLSVGPGAHIVAGEKVIFGLTASPRFTVDFGHEWSRIVKPYAHLGPGLAVVAGEDRRHNRHTQAGLLISAGVGVEFYLWDGVSIGSGLMFNFLPTRLVDETFYFGWKVLEMKGHF